MNSYTKDLIKKISKNSNVQKCAVKYFFNQHAKDKLFDEKVIKQIKIGLNKNLLSAFATNVAELEAKVSYVFYSFDWCLDRYLTNTESLEIFNCIGSDGRFRSAVYCISYLLFLDDKLLVYQAKVNTILASCDEYATEIFYKDITSIQLSNEEKVVIRNKSKDRTHFVPISKLIINNSFSYISNDGDALKECIKAINAKRIKYQNN